MMNSPAMSARRGCGDEAACGRVVNAAVAAIGPDLDPGGRRSHRSRRSWRLSGTGAKTAGNRQPSERAANPHDAGCQLEAALFLQQLAVFAPQTAPPDVLVRRLRPYLASGDASLRRVAAATLRHVCERDASAVLRSVHMTHASGSDGSRRRIGKGVLKPRGVGGGLEADLLALLDGYGGGNEGSGRLADDDGFAVRDATRALWLLTGANAFDDPAKAARRLAAVALHAPGRDWGGDGELDGGAEGCRWGCRGCRGFERGGRRFGRRGRAREPNAVGGGENRVGRRRPRRRSSRRGSSPRR